MPDATPAPPRIYRVIVPVPDIDQAIRFYTALLGYPGERVAVTRHYFDCGGVVLACVDQLRDGPGHFRPNPDTIYLAVDDLEAWLRRARDAGATVAREIETHPWGERSCYVRDPFDNSLCFVDDATLFLGGRFIE